MIRKEDARCCNAARDTENRLPIGFCGPNCERRIERDLVLAARRPPPKPEPKPRPVKRRPVARVQRPPKSAPKPAPPKRPARPATCNYRGCVREVVDRGWCARHRP